MLANRVCSEQKLSIEFETAIKSVDMLSQQTADILLLPPALANDYYLNADEALLKHLQTQHQQGCIIASACAGAFIVAASEVIGPRALTTHWGLAQQLQHRFPRLNIDASKILIDHGDVITAGGMMSWLDLGLEVIAKFASPAVMRQVGKMLVVDTAAREQRFYQQFVPPMSHADQAIIAVQQWLNQNYAMSIQLPYLAELANMSERTFQRRFLKATAYSPNKYLQHLRIQKACDLLETTSLPFASISPLVGYEDTSACRKVFQSIMGLTPVEFRRRFGHS